MEDKSLVSPSIWQSITDTNDIIIHKQIYHLFPYPQNPEEKKKVNTMSDMVPFILPLPSQVPCIINQNLFFQTAKMQC